MDALRDHNGTLKADIEALKAMLAAAEVRIERQALDLATQASDSASRDAQSVADLAAERAKTEKAIEAFSSLADRLDALAAERARPWWRRLTG